MKEYILEFMRRFDYPEEAEKAIGDLYERISKDSRDARLFEDLLEVYRNDYRCDFKEIFEKAEMIADHLNVTKYEVNELILICMSSHLRTLYSEKGYSETMWEESMYDLKYKLLKCRMIKGVWGNFAAQWETGFFDLTRFAFGRLQFEAVIYSGEVCEVNGVKIIPGDRIINVHIPRTQTPLTKEACDEAYRRAREFFRKRYDRTFPFIMFSWILYPPYKKLFAETSNLYRFAETYKVLGTVEDKSMNDNMWRIFNMDWTGDVEDYP